MKRNGGKTLKRRTHKDNIRRSINRQSPWTTINLGEAFGSFFVAVESFANHVKVGFGDCGNENSARLNGCQTKWISHELQWLFTGRLLRRTSLMLLWDLWIFETKVISVFLVWELYGCYIIGVIDRDLWWIFTSLKYSIRHFAFLDVQFNESFLRKYVFNGVNFKRKAA